MTMLVTQYKIQVKEEPEFAHETFEGRYARITAFYEGLTMVCVSDVRVSMVILRLPSSTLRVPFGI